MKKKFFSFGIIMVLLAMTSFLHAQNQNNVLSPAEFQKQLNNFNQSQLFPLTNSNNELFRLGDVIWQRMAGENEYYLAPQIRDLDTYKKRIRALDNKAAGVVKSVSRIARIPLDQKVKSLLAQMNIRVPDYYTGAYLNAQLPLLDIDFLNNSGIDVQILKDYGKKPVIATDNPATNVVIWSEGWEGSMSPYTIENISGSPSTNWKDVFCASYAGSWSLWCAGGGTQPQPGCASYVNNMNTYVYKTYGIDIHAYTNVKFKFYYKYQTETDYDFFNYYISADGLIWLNMQTYSGTSAGYPLSWQSNETMISNIGTLTFKFEFTSDYSNVFGGAYVDNLEVTGDDDCNSTQAYSSLLTPTPNWDYDYVSYVGGYWLFNVTEGTQYHFSLCPEQLGEAGMFDSELILRKESTDEILVYADDVCGNDARISWTAGFTGNVKLVMKKYHCTNWFPPGIGIARLMYKSGPLENPYMTTSPGLMNFNPDTYWSYPASLQLVTVTTNLNVPWTVSTSDSWILLPAGFTGGTGSQTFNITCGNNNGSSARAGMLYVESPLLGTHTIYIYQREGCESSNMYNSDTSSFTVTDNWQYLENIHAGQYAKFYMPRGYTYNFSLCPAHGGDAPYDSQLTIRDANDNVEAYSDDDCGDDALVSSALSPIGLVTLQYKVIVSQINCSSNTTDTRLAYKRGTLENPSLAVSPDLVLTGADSISTNLAITSNTSWTIDDNVEWMEINPNSGVGNAFVTVTILGNSGVLRYGLITASAYGIYPVNVSVTQTGTTVPLNLNLQNMTVPSPSNVCFAAYQTITLAGGGTYFTVENGGIVEMVAGQKISILPGADVQPGGYFYGHISSSGAYCPSSKFASSAWNNGESFNQSSVSQGNDRFFRIYPNPTTGKLTLEMTDADGITPLRVELYGIVGEKLMSLELPAARINTIDLSGRNSGMYMLRVTREGRTAFEKIIKN